MSLILYLVSIGVFQLIFYIELFEFLLGNEGMINFSSNKISKMQWFDKNLWDSEIVEKNFLFLQICYHTYRL